MTSAMALSLLQDAQTRGLAAALAGIKREEVDRSLTMSPPMTSNHHHHHHQTPVYPRLHHAAAASALGMLSPSQLMAANAFMAAQLPMSKLASVASLFPHHPALFGTWGQPPLIPPPTNGPHSPPTSPISPITSHNSSTSASLSKKLNNNNNNNLTNNNNNNNNNIGSTQNIDVPVTKKSRKISVKKDLMSPPLEIPINNGDIYNSGPISPPSSGSSPNSQQDVPVVHGNSKDPSRDKSFTCKICNRSFGYKHVLQNHERTHTGEKPFECPECHKRFTRDHHLKTHMRLHTGEKPYHCSHCDRQFVQVANLRRHLRVHTGERPYTCEICESRFSDSNQLKSHILIHNGEKPFECERCHLKFRRRHHLMHHKCGIQQQSPPTPAISPAISDYGMSEQKSTISSFASDESTIDLNKSNGILNNSYDDNVILSVGTGSTSNSENEKRSRKSTDIRRVVRLPPQQIVHVPTTLPEQTEPEDLSIRSPRSLHSPMSSHHDDDLEDLDDAATLHFKQRQRMVQNSTTTSNIVQHLTPKWHMHMEQD